MIGSRVSKLYARPNGIPLRGPSADTRPVDRALRVVPIADHPLESGQPGPRPIGCFAAFALATGISDQGCQSAVSLVLNHGSQLVVRLRCVSVESGDLYSEQSEKMFLNEGTRMTVAISCRLGVAR